MHIAGLRKEHTPEVRRQRRLLRWYRLAVGLRLMFLAGLLTAFWTLGIEPDLLTVTRLTIVSRDLPANWDGRVVAFFTDTHVGPSFDARRLERVADAIERKQPDLILFGGDLIDHRTPADNGYIASIGQVLARMTAPLGKYAIRGNHDNRLRAELKIAEAMLQAGGFQMLVNQSVELDGILLGGLDESYFGKPDLAAAFPAETAETAEAAEAAGSRSWRLLLMHQPDFGAALPSGSADLTLSGHTHNGQISFFGKPVSTVYQGRLYTYGRYVLADGRQLVVSRGLGTIGMAARFWSPPELMLITLRRG